MRQFINGKLCEMSEEKIAKMISYFGNNMTPRKNTSDYENRIKELENTVAELMTKLESAKQ
jgi:hypothetical protein